MNNNQQIKNLLFDLGGVIVDIRRQRCVEALQALGFTDANDFLGEYAQKGEFFRLEEGTMSVADFHAFVHTHCRPDVTDEQIDRAFQAFIVGIPRERLEWIRHYRRMGYRTYVLSNTNPIMWHGVIAENFRQEGLTIHDYFDGIVTSFEEGVCKPHARIFEACVEKFGIKPQETLFFDDSQANCDAAARLGFHTQHVAPGNEFYRLFK